MKIYLQRELREAYAHAAEGGIALHICTSAGLVTAAAPGCFRRSQQFAHLFDQNLDRLLAMAKKFGVRVIRPQHCGTHRQHIDLCGRPLERAIAHVEWWEQKQKTASAQVLLDLTGSLEAQLTAANERATG